MKTLNVIIVSKNTNKINNYILFFLKYLAWSLYSIKKNFYNTIKRKKFSLLKSPHVNKKAQEHFESKFIKKCFFVKVQKIFKFIIFFKKVSHKIFSDITIQYKQIFTKSNKLCLSILNINNFKIKVQNNKFFGNNFKLKKKVNKLRINYKLKNINVKKNIKLIILLNFYSKNLKQWL